MLKNKRLMEKRSMLLREAEELQEKVEKDENGEVLEKLKEVLDKIEAIDEVLEKLNKSEDKTVKDDDQDKDAKATETRSRLLAGEEIQVRDMTSTNTKGIATFNGDIVTQRPKEVSLKDFVRIEYFNGNTIVPVQKNKMGKLVKAAELAEITKKDILVEQVDLRPEKYALLTVISEELLNDVSYDAEALIRQEGLEAIDETIVAMMADTLNKAEGTVKVAPKAPETIALEDVNGLYFGLKAEYRKNAAWVVNSTHLKALFNLVGTDGQPILTRDLTTHFGFTIYGRPVVECGDIKDMMFVDMEKALVVGVGKDAQVKRSDDAYFATAGIAFRTSIPLDVKSCIETAAAKLAA